MGMRRITALDNFWPHFKMKCLRLLLMLRVFVYSSTVLSLAYILSKNISLLNVHKFKLGIL